jgi:hypothetical protein
MIQSVWIKHQASKSGIKGSARDAPSLPLDAPLLDIHKALPKSLREASLTLPPGAARCPPPLSCSSIRTGARALPPDARSRDDDCRSADAEHLPERARRRRCKELRHGQRTLGGVNAHVRGQ